MLAKAYSSYTIVDVVDGLQWQGNSSSPPENPQMGWAYYNIKDGKSYLWDGEKWVEFAHDGADGRDAPEKKETEQYAQHSSYSTPPPANSEKWKDEFPQEWKNDMPYIWYRVKQEWTSLDGEYITKYTSAVLMSQLDVATQMAQSEKKSLAQWCKDNNTSIIDGATIATGTVTADQIKSHSITADQIAAGSLVIGSFDKKTQDIINNSVNSTIVEYCLSYSDTNCNERLIDWQTDFPGQLSNYYIWQRTTITKSNGDISQTEVCIQGAAGKDGEDAIYYYIESSKGMSFKQGQEGTTTLTAHLYKRNKEMDVDGEFVYTWYIKTGGANVYLGAGKTISVDIKTIIGKSVYFVADDGGASASTAMLSLACLGEMVLGTP